MKLAVKRKRAVGKREVASLDRMRKKGSGQSSTAGFDTPTPAPVPQSNWSSIGRERLWPARGACALDYSLWILVAVQNRCVEEFRASAAFEEKVTGIVVSALIQDFEGYKVHL